MNSSQNSASKISVKHEYNSPNFEIHRRKTNIFAPCPGEAHSNPHIDYCGICSPKWGWINILKEIDLEEAFENNFDIPLGELTNEQYELVMKMVDDNLMEMVSVTRDFDYGTKSYLVVRKN